MLRQLPHRREAVIRHLLLADLQELGHVAVRPAFDQQQFQHLQPHVIALLLPLADQLAQAAGDGLAFDFHTLVGPGQARRPRLAAVDLVVQRLGRRLGAGLHRPAAHAAELIGDLVGGDREEVGLQLALLVEIRQAVQEADERLLDHVLAGGPVAEAAVGERQQPALVAGDELLPARFGSPAGRICWINRRSLSDGIMSGYPTRP